MLLFWFIAALLVALTVATLLWPLLRARNAALAPGDQAAAIAVYRDQKRALDAECDAGSITASERDAALSELAQRVSEDVTAPPPATEAVFVRKRAWAPAIALLLLVPAVSFFLYQRLGNPAAAVVAAARAVVRPTRCPSGRS